jgi:hypothetical protein
MSTALQLLGTAAIVAGAALISIPAGVIVGGVLLIVIGLALGR